MIPIIHGAEKKIQVIPETGLKDELSDLHHSRQIAEILMAVYPRYHWLVNTDSKNGIVTIKCGEISTAVLSNRTPGMVLHIKNLSDVSITRKIVIRSAGELLERANLKRGPWDGQEPKRVDGLKDRHQPREVLTKQPNIIL